jgi:hypothetical protein
MNVVVDPLIASISTEERRPIVDRFRARLSAANVDLNSFWREMLEFWSAGPPEQTEATLLLRMALFHRLVNEPGRPFPSFATLGLANHDHSLAPRSRREDRLQANSAKAPRRTKSEVHPDYLDRELVGDVINAASILTQQYGKTFNARLTIWHRAFGIEDILAAHKEFWDKVWWNRHQSWLRRIETGEESLTEAEKPILESANSAARRIERRFGKSGLRWGDFEWGLLNGHLSGLSWVLGSDWDESLDT